MFPSVLKKASVLPIYKKADKLEKGNYRPMSLLQILAKIFEKILAHQISRFLNGVLYPHLSVFRQGYIAVRRPCSVSWNIGANTFLVYQKENRSSTNGSEQGVRLYAPTKMK